ncbi:chitinase-3-like protein 1 [Rhipicephalus microplus]|uniref:chitinase-3-like protein 1 n=1 Tax=Rhipicephalus microplus TaxID=6941 RepID=UPI003F6C91A6
MVVFLTFFTCPGRAFPTSMVIPGVATRVTGVSSPFTIPKTSPGLPRVTFDPDEGFFLQPGETIQDFCSKEMEPDERPPAPSAPVPTGKSLNTTTKDIQQRPVICVFNAKYWRLQDTYFPDFIPVHYCTAILWYGYAVDVKDGSIVWKYPSAKTYKNSLLVMLYNGQLSHRGNNISVYFALGGAREDNANLSLMVGNPETRRRLVAYVWLELNNPFQPWTGVNVDWDYPGEPCNPGTGSGAFVELINDLKRQFIDVIISVPPVKSRLHVYSLDKVIGLVDFIIIKTHMHTANPSMRDAVRCSGDHSDAADVFNAALSSLPKSDDDWRLGYSISVAPETFVAPAARLGVPVLGTAPWDNQTRQPGRTSYASVCQEKPVIRTNSHPLCLMVARQMENQNILVATFSDERALMERMNLTYSSNMALAPVAVYDIDLDDFAGECGNGLSPLIRALATGPG